MFLSVSLIFLLLLTSHSLDPTTIVVAINAGSTSSYVSTMGFTYTADQYNTGGSTYSCSCTITGTSNPTPYRSERFSGSTHGYRIPISTDGVYVIILQFSEIYFVTTNSRVFSVRLGSLTLRTNMDLVALVGGKQAYDIFTEFTLTAGVVRVNGNIVTGAMVSGRLVIDLVPTKENAKISSLILVRGNCYVADNCNQCYDTRCSVCNSVTAICTTCIAGATAVNGVCGCNANAFWVSASRTCTVCDNLCGACVSAGAFLCTACQGTNVLISNVCLRACPYGFTSPCVSVSTQVINTNFDNFFYGTYGLFRTALTSSTYHFFNSPESSDPEPAKNRGLYFSGGDYLETISSVYISLNFSLGMWVRVLSGSIMSRSPNNRISISNTGAMTVILEGTGENTISRTTLSINPSIIAWAYISYISTYNPTTMTTTITSYLNKNAITSMAVTGVIYRDALSNTIILGKNGASNFNGFIYQFSL